MANFVPFIIHQRMPYSLSALVFIVPSLCPSCLNISRRFRRWAQIFRIWCDVEFLSGIGMRNRRSPFAALR